MPEEVSMMQKHVDVDFFSQSVPQSAKVIVDHDPFRFPLIGHGHILAVPTLLLISIIIYVALRQTWHVCPLRAQVTRSPETSTKATDLHIADTTSHLESTPRARKGPTEPPKRRNNGIDVTNIIGADHSRSLRSSKTSQTRSNIMKMGL
jgi:hypothetical protein